MKFVLKYAYSALQYNVEALALPAILTVTIMIYYTEPVKPEVIHSAN